MKKVALIAVACFCMGALIFNVGCAKKVSPKKMEKLTGRTLVKCVPPQEKCEILVEASTDPFVGVRTQCRIPVEYCLTDARMDAARRVFEKHGTLGVAVYWEARKEIGKPVDDTDFGHVIDDVKGFFVKNYVAGMTVTKRYWEEYSTADGKLEYDVYVFQKVDEEFAKRALQKANAEALQKAKEEKNQSAQELLEYVRRKFGW